MCAYRQRNAAEHAAVAALERGLAFTEEEGIDGEDWMDDPRFVDAIQTLARMNLRPVAR